jgi:hypothetical protein
MMVVVVMMVAMAAVSIEGAVGGGGGAACDIFDSGGTPCVAAHSTVRSLYRANTHALFQLKRSSDNATKDVTPVETGFADFATQTEFCQGECGCVPWQCGCG